MVKVPELRSKYQKYGKEKQNYGQYTSIAKLPEICCCWILGLGISDAATIDSAIQRQSLVRKQAWRVSKVCANLTLWNFWPTPKLRIVALLNAIFKAATLLIQFLILVLMLLTKLPHMSRSTIHYTEAMELLKNIDPPLGFGKKCPDKMAYKRLIRWTMN